MVAECDAIGPRLILLLVFSILFEYDSKSDFNGAQQSKGSLF